jgi:hypothetical protein
MRVLERSVIVLDLRHGGEPKALVKQAVRLKKEAAAKARSHEDDNLEYDQVWCVFDVDQHALLLEAKQQARDSGIEVAISNPCFELWALLHFRDQRAHIKSGKLHLECKKYMPEYEKRLPTSQLHPLCDDALKRARELDRWQSSRGCQGDNPSTGVYKLMEQIRAAGKP